MKCNVCSATGGLSPHPYVQGAFLCFEHKPRPKPAPVAGAIVIDRDELLGLKIEGLVSLRSYVYFALRIDGVASELKSLDLAAFCDRWSVNEADVVGAIASLSKKGIVRSVFRVDAQAVTHKERVAAMEESLGA